jgi:CheY-like chemotaxis protein
MNQHQRVAIIDDELDMNEVIVEYLATLGISAQSFTDAEKALEAIGDGSGWNLILSDLRMPKMSGLEFLRRLNEAGVRVPVVFMSGHLEDSLKELALTSGARAVLLKPFDFKEIMGYLQEK